MNIKQALKQKNRLVQELNQLIQRMTNNNTVIEGNERPYSAKQTLTEIYVKISELNILKTQIHIANVPVYDKIFLMGELKSLVKNLKSMSCTNGIDDDYYGRRSDTTTVKNSEITVVDRDNEVKNLEDKIEKLQDELDEHNLTTQILEL
jgi:hypothetical protein